MVAQERVTRLLQPWLGAAFLQRCDLAQQAADTLNGCDIAQTPIALLAKDLDEMIFHTLRDMTFGDMRVLLDDGRTMRVRVDDVDAMADEWLYLTLCGRFICASRPFKRRTSWILSPAPCAARIRLIAGTNGCNNTMIYKEGNYIG